MALALSPAFAATMARADDGNCLTAQEGTLLTRGLDGLIRAQGLNTDSEAAIALAHKLIGIVQRCDADNAASAATAHDADVAAKARAEAWKWRFPRHSAPQDEAPADAPSQD
jgi:hypothetical protein